MRPVSGVFPEVVRIIPAIVMPFIHDPVTWAVEHVLGAALVIVPTQIVYIPDAPVRQAMVRRQRRGGSWIQRPLAVIRNRGIRTLPKMPIEVVVVIGVHGRGQSDLLQVGEAPGALRLLLRFGQS